ncbi:MAG TPA: FAD-linked oxidase C-terminal domain-containing protein [Acidimicrobiia bacterium]
MALVEELVALLGADRVLTEPLERHVFAKDAGLRSGTGPVVVFPETTAEVAACVRLAKSHRVPVVPRGAGTGLAGGAVPVEESVAVVLTRMNTIEEVDRVGKAVWVGPGVINLDLSRHTAPWGLHFAPDPSSQAACTIGGNVANNSGGPHCLAEGTTVNHVLALEMVTGDGQVVRIGSEAPDPIGLDLRGVVVGSEGTLGIVTRVLVRLTPDPPAVRTLVAAFDLVKDAAATVSDTIAAGIVPAALEIMDQLMIRAVERFAACGFPTEAAAILIAEVTGSEQAVVSQAGFLHDVAQSNGATEVRVAVDEAERDLIWKGRKSAFGAVAQTAPDYYLHDTVVPRTRLVEVLEEVYRIADRHDLVMMNVFHAGDGNLHPLMAFDAQEPGVMERVQAAASEIVRVSVEAGGVLSGEHGIGLEKRDLMPLMFTPADLDAQACIREAFDPDAVLNPGKVLPSGARCIDVGRRLPEGAWV